MRSAAFNIGLALVGLIQPLQATHTGDDMSADKLVDRLIHRLVTHLQARLFENFADKLVDDSLDSADLDSTTLKKPGLQANFRTNLRPFVPLYRTPGPSTGSSTSILVSSPSQLRRQAMPCHHLQALVRQRTRVRKRFSVPRAEPGVVFPGPPMAPGMDNLNDVDTTYGEITAQGLKVFTPYVRTEGPNHFLDLGSGKGSALLQMYSLFPGPVMTSMTGIEFDQARHDAAVELIRGAFGSAPPPISNSEYHFGAFHLYCGDIFDARFIEVIQQASIAYVANLNFPNEANEKLRDLLPWNKEAVVVSCIQLSSYGCTPTFLEQTWIDDELGYIWKVGDERTESQVYQQWKDGEIQLDQTERRAYAIHWLDLAIVSGGQSLDGKKYSQPECFQKAIFMDPTYTEAWFYMGGIGGVTVDGNFSEQDFLEQGLALDPKYTQARYKLPSGTPDAAMAWYKLGEIGYARIGEKIYNRTTCFKNAVALNPKNAQAWMRLGEAGGGDFEDEMGCADLECFQNAILLEPKNARAWLSFGAAGGRMMDGRDYSKMDIYQKALNLDPKIGEIWFKMGTLVDQYGVVVDSKRYSGFDCLLQSLTVNPLFAEGWKILGVAGGGEVDQKTYSTTECFQNALTWDPTLSDTWNNLGVTGGGIVAGRRYSEKECVKQSLNLYPLYDRAWINFADMADMKGEEIDGKNYTYSDCLMKALEIQPGNSKAWHNLGATGGGNVNGRWLSQVGCFEQAVAVNPKYATAWFSLGASGGTSQLNATKFSSVTEAKRYCYQRGIELSPAYAQGWYNLGSEGGGTVNGTSYSEEECMQQSLALDRKFEEIQNLTRVPQP